MQPTQALNRKQVVSATPPFIADVIHPSRRMNCVSGQILLRRICKANISSQRVIEFQKMRFAGRCDGPDKRKTKEVSKKMKSVQSHK